MDYECRLTWTGNRGRGTASYEEYGRDFDVVIAGKPLLAGSANHAFRGDAARHDPEDLLLAALSACHMLAYLALCARRGIRILEYSDSASGTLALDASGGGRFTGVTLRPRVVVAGDANLAVAAALLDAAHAQCFIASSCNFPVSHRETVVALESAASTL